MYWGALLHPVNAVFHLFLLGAALTALRQNDHKLRLVGWTIAIIVIASWFEYRNVSFAVVGVLTDLIAFGFVTYVAVRHGPTWSLFMSAWVGLALATSVFLLMSPDADAHGVNTALTINRLWWYLAGAALLAGVFEIRSSPNRGTGRPAFS